MAEDISTGGAAFSSIYVWLALLLVVDATLFLGPLLVFTSKLWASRTKGMTATWLAARYVNVFERKWLESSNRPVDGRSDLYAVGCLGYWLVTGQLVFEGRTAMEVMLQHVQTKPEPPSRRTEQDIPESFDALILACLEKDPGDRPPTADAVAARLNPIETRSTWSTERARQWWDLHHPSADDSARRGKAPEQALDVGGRGPIDAGS
jgi:serine/threonine protein kinase